MKTEFIVATTLSSLQEENIIWVCIMLRILYIRLDNILEIFDKTNPLTLFQNSC